MYDWADADARLLLCLSARLKGIFPSFRNSVNVTTFNFLSIFYVFAIYVAKQPNNKTKSKKAKSPKGNLVWEDINIQSVNVFICLFSLCLDALFYIVIIYCFYILLLI